MLGLLLVMALVAAVGSFGRQAYKKVSESKLVAQAGKCLEKKDFKNAALCLQRALQISPASAKASELTADLLETVGSPAALSWRIRTAQLQTNNINYRFAWAQTALRLQDPNAAAFALSSVGAMATNSAIYHKLMGALAWETKHAAEAEKQYLEALRQEPANQTILLNLATVRLSSTNQAVADAARLSLQQVPANSSLRPTALRYLIADAQVHNDPARARIYSKELVDDPGAALGDRIGRLQLLHESRSLDFGPWLAALEEEAQKSPEPAAALGRWMLSAEGATNALSWLQTLPPTIQTNQPVPLVVSDCLIQLKNWKAELALVEKQDWGEANSFRLALESLARRSLGQEAGAQVAWRKSLGECSHRLDLLSRLAQVTGLWGWKTEKIDVLRQVAAEFPRERWATDQLIAELYEAGNTTELGELLSKVCDLDPDARMKNCLANVCLLRKTELEKGYRLASEAYNSSTNNPFFISTYAYSLLLQNRQDEALKVVSALTPEFLEVPSVAAYYGVIQAQTGHKEIAKAPLQRAESARLLPEEKEIVRLARAKL
jgi:predicted Zn-dependent protease